MATKAKMTDQEAPEQVSTPLETEYTVSEFAKASEKVFDTTPEMVIAAFRVNNITKATKSRAIEIVAAFAQKEVK